MIGRWFSVVLTGAVTAGVAFGGEREVRPNFIFYITDDISWNDVGPYGNEAIHTPNLDRMAREGMVFENAYLTISSCSPSRCSIITGRYPHNTGAPELHTPLPAGQFAFPEALRKAGYYTVLSGKHHMGENVNGAFDKISPGQGPGKEADWVQILRERPENQPFFCWFASTDAHRNWQENSNAPRYDPATVVVPPFLYDGPQTRRDLTGYYHEISRTDYYLGELMQEVERQGIAGDTYLIYCSDNGRPFPRCKTRLYDSGIKTPLIISCPGRVPAARSRALVSVIDFAPTILELAGLPTPPSIQGVSFTPVLRNPRAKIRDYAFAEHNWHVYQSHERMVRFGRWMYIRNAWPDRQNLCAESDPTFPAGAELWSMHRQNRLVPAQTDIFLLPRPAEELYDVEADPYQVHNLAASPDITGILNHLRGIMDQWISETGDTIPANPTQDRQNLQGNRYPGWRHREFPGAARQATHINQPGPILNTGTSP